MPVDSSVVASLAQRHSLPPPIVAALANQKPPLGLLSSYGLDERQGEDPAAALTVITHALAQSIAQGHGLEQAISHVFAGDPAAYMSPTGSVGGLVVGILADAAVNVARGWEAYQPVSREAFTRVADNFSNFLNETRELGGPVTDESLSFWHKTVAPYAPPTKTPSPVSGGTGAIKQAPLPAGPDPRHVEEFAGELKGRGIDVGHFLDNFPLLSSLRYKMLRAKTSLSHYAEVSSMTPTEIQQHVRGLPHPVYPNLTAGQYSDAHDAATLHAINYVGRQPRPAEVARLAAAGAKWGDVGNYYLQQKEATGGRKPQ